MIVVIADDITGAAEIAGIGHNYGLKVILTRNINISLPQCDLLVIITNTRSLNEETAIEHTRYIGNKLKTLNPDFIFKKTDSVLRGHVAAELNTLLSETGKKRALLLPANPSLGRKIINGKYYINGESIINTAFSYDPEYPAKSDSVLDILGDGVLIDYNYTDTNQGTKIFVGNLETEEELREYCKMIDKDVIPAGGASFFRAYLSEIHNLSEIKSDYNDLSVNQMLMICGS